jgi:hypothetical protein
MFKSDNFNKKPYKSDILKKDLEMLLIKKAPRSNQQERGVATTVMRSASREKPTAWAKVRETLLPPVTVGSHERKAHHAVRLASGFLTSS